jgi:hypothetical protein
VGIEQVRLVGIEQVRLVEGGGCGEMESVRASAAARRPLINAARIS